MGLKDTGESDPSDFPYFDETALIDSPEEHDFVSREYEEACCPSCGKSVEVGVRSCSSCGAAWDTKAGEESLEEGIVEEIANSDATPEQPEDLGIYATSSFRAIIDELSRGRLEIGIGPKVDSLLVGAQQVAIFYRSFFEWLLSNFNLTTVSPTLRPLLNQLSRELAYGGLYCNCVLYDYPHRLDFSKIDREELHSQWAQQSLTANSFMNTSDSMNNGWPSAIFSVMYERVEDIQKQLGLGWWKRSKNKNKFKNLFASGLLLGFMHDAKTEGRAFPARAALT
jgi:hypothetical protein